MPLTVQHDPGEEKKTVKDCHLHHQYNEVTLDMDFAILELHDFIAFSNTTRPACLPEFNCQDYTGKKGEVIFMFDSHML